MPRLKRLDMRGTQLEAAASAAAAAAPVAEVFPPSPTAAPALEFLAFGYRRYEAIPVAHHRNTLTLGSFLSRWMPTPYARLRSLLLERVSVVLGGVEEGEEGAAAGGQVARLRSAFTFVFPALRMVHLHLCTEDSGSRAVFDELANVYDLVRSTSSGGGGGAAARGAGGGARRGGGSAFKGICRGCVGYTYEVLKWSGLAREVQDF